MGTLREASEGERQCERQEPEVGGKYSFDKTLIVWVDRPKL